MRLRVTKVDEYQLLTCLRHGVWGSKSARFKDWKQGDLLAFLVDKGVAGYAEVSGEPFESSQLVWDNGLFPHRINITFRHIIAREQRPPILGQIREAFIAAFGNTYGWGILTQQLLPEAPAEQLIAAIKAYPSALSDIQSQLTKYVSEAQELRAAVIKNKRPVKTKKLSASAIPVAPLPGPSEGPVVPVEVAQEDSLHSRAQYLLIELGKAAGCSVWIAANDRNRLYKGKALGETCISVLPEMGLNPEAKKRIGLIDVIWLQKNNPVCAFEVETSTSIYSGLLRMSDFLALVPLLKLELFIVAPGERQGKTMEELDRPTFRKIGLSDYCRFISISDLEKLLEKVSDLRGHIQPSLLDTVAVALQDPAEAALQ